MLHHFYMKKLCEILIGLILVGGAIFGCYKFVENKNKKEEYTPAPHSHNETSDTLLDEVLSNMTLEQKIGQMMIIRNEYQSMTDDFENDIEEIQPGGYIIFDVNITTLAGTKQFVSETRAKMEEISTVALANGSTVTIPAIMSVDQEGGLVQRLQSISDYPPEYVSPMLEIGATGSSEKAFSTGRLLAEECKSVGLNLDFAPVADIFSNPQNTVIGNRAFGTDKETVATMSTALAAGLHDNGVLHVYKHFPGHGDTEADSHVSLPVVTKTLDELNKNELYPFKKAIEAGAEMIMVAHIALPNVTDDYTPASLSSTVVTDVLKNWLGYQGLVITDGLDMGALTQNYSNADIAVKAATAGADILLTPVSPVEAKEALIDAVRDGTITEKRIDESVRKILDLKLKHLN